MSISNNISSQSLLIISILINTDISSGESRSNPSSPSRAAYELRLDPHTDMREKFGYCRRQLTKLKAIYKKPLPDDNCLVTLPEIEGSYNVSSHLSLLLMYQESLKQCAAIPDLKIESETKIAELEHLKDIVKKHLEIMETRESLIDLSKLINGEKNTRFAKITEFIKKHSSPDLGQLYWLVGHVYSEHKTFETAKSAVSNDIGLRKTEYLQVIPLVQELSNQTNVIHDHIKMGNDIVENYNLTQCYLSDQKTGFFC